MKKKEEDKMITEIADYFADVVMFICQMSCYKLSTVVDEEAIDEKIFSVKVNFPYRQITLYIQPTGIKWYQAKDWEAIRLSLLHEAFHVIHWKYMTYAEHRYVEKEALEEMEEDMADKFSLIVDALWKQIKK